MNESMISGSHGTNTKLSEQLRLLNDVSMHLQSLLDSEDFFQEIVKLIQSRFHYYSVHMWTVEEDGSAVLRAQSGAYAKHLPIGFRLKSGSERGILGQVILTNESYLSNDVANDPLFTNLSFPVHTQSELCVPVKKGNEIVAALGVESDRLDAFDQEDLITLGTLAAQVSVAMTNRALYWDTKEFSNRLQTAVQEKTQELRDAHEQILSQQKLLEKENKALKSLVRTENKPNQIVGTSPAIRSILTMTEKIAPTSATVLIQGESGTGKELIARLLHVLGECATGPYITVNCGALQESLLESELFGHEKGSFTGAVTQKLGLAEAADGGTIFLDEIGEMSLGIQAKLLRFLQEGEFYRIGGKRPIRVNVRVVSATNRDLEQEVKTGRFREDLFYRLNTITLRMPPLRERPQDIPLLVEHFLVNSRFGSNGNGAMKVDPRVLEAFQKYIWPGNIRELQNIIERMKILAEGNTLRIEDVPFTIRYYQKGEERGTAFHIGMSLEDVERTHILSALEHHQGNKTKTAQSLGITIKTLYNKLHRYGILKQAEPQGVDS